MRKLLLGIVIILSGASHVAAQQLKATISGKIDSLKSNKLYLYKKDLIGSFTFTCDTIIVAADGSFKKELLLTDPVFFTITSFEKGRFGSIRTQLFVAPGYDLKLTGKAKYGINLATATISGVGAEVNHYLQAKQDKYFYNSTDFYSMRFVSMISSSHGKEEEVRNYKLIQQSNTQAFLQQPKIYLDTVTKYYAAQRNALEAFAKKVNTKQFEEFKKLELANINYGEADAKLMYEKNHNGYAKLVKVDSIAIPADWYSFLTPELIKSDAAVIFSESYRLFMINYFEYLNETNPLAAKRAWTGVSKDVVIATSLYQKNEKYNKNVTQEQLDEVEANLKSAIATAARPSVFQSVKDQLIPLRNYLRVYGTGKNAFNFKAVDVNGKPVQLADFKGKVIYVDVWASWCKPCVGEIPFGRVLEEKFKDRKDVVFVTVSIEKKVEDWKSGLEKNNPAGIPLYVEGAFGGDFAKSFEISSIPRFMIIDKNGKFINANAPRPSQEKEVIAILNKAIGI